MSRSPRLGGIRAVLLIGSLSGAGVAGAQPQGDPDFLFDRPRGVGRCPRGLAVRAGRQRSVHLRPGAAHRRAECFRCPDVCVRRWRRRGAANRGGLRCRVRRRDHSLRVPGSRRQRSAADYAGDPPPPDEPERQFKAGTDAAAARKSGVLRGFRAPPPRTSEPGQEPCGTNSIRPATSSISLICRCSATRFSRTAGLRARHVFAGVDVKLARRVFLTGEGRYLWSQAELGPDFSSFQPIDLTGFKLTVGINYLF